MVLGFIIKRKFLIVGIFLILLSLDVLMTRNFIIYDMTPRMGEIFPYVVVPPVTKNLPDFVITMYSWPFLTPALLGIVFTVIGINQIREERKMKFTERSEVGEAFAKTKREETAEKEGETSGSE